LALVPSGEDLRNHLPMNLFLRRVHHPQARDNYRIVVKLDGDEFEVGSIGVQTTNTGTIWTWGLDGILPMGDIESEGTGKGVGECMRRFRAAWDRFSADPTRLSEFMRLKRAAR
jgi:hypothetical protein